MPGTNINYLLHISNVAMEVLLAYNHDSSFDLNFTVQVAILHDTLEDTETTFEEVTSVFGNSIAEGVLALTKSDKFGSKEERMIDSLNRINQLRKEVGMVKIADRITNLQSPPEHWSNEKIKNYHKEAQLISESLKDKHEYLNERLKSKIEDYSNYLNR